MTQQKSNPTPNRLANEKSPYLLQHAWNPVDWYAWGDEAFKKAREENKPVLLSIGYSTCHWCHVMEHESFEDPEVAALMNEHVVSIKVDREERPDIDHIYMAVCQMLTGSGGWPLTIFLTPDRKPFYAATYIPKEPRYGRPGMMQMIPQIHAQWLERQEEIVHYSEEISQQLSNMSGDHAGDLLGSKALNQAYDQLSNRFDRVFGGFGNAPKFPTPHQFLFLLRYWKRTGDQKALEMVEKSLSSMRKGGIYDQVGFGFHRYSTDREWLVPHFEKMLYDQALLLLAYTETYQATHKEEYAAVAHEIAEYVLRDMTSPDGGFYSAEDADSEGEEGKFYLWKQKEWIEILGSEDGTALADLFQFDEFGNFVDQIAGHRTGDNIPHLRKPLNGAEEDLWERSRKKLFDVREKRVHPHKDDKILTDWNGLMIAALAKAGRILSKPLYIDAARKASGFVLQTLRNSDGELLHRFRDGEAGITANLDDHAFFVWGLLELYESTFDVFYLSTALKLTEYQVQHFWDSANGSFFFASDRSESLLVRNKEIYDGAIPSGNSVSMLNLLRLGRITGNVEFEKRAEQIERGFSQSVEQIPSAHSLLMIGIQFRIGPTFEVVIVGDLNREDTQIMLRELDGVYNPGKVVIFRPAAESDPEIARIAPFTKNQTAIDGKATAYVCKNFVCSLPATEVEEMLKQLV